VTQRAALLAVFWLTAGLAEAQVSRHAVRFFGTGAGQQDRIRIPVDDDAPGPNRSAPIDVGQGGFTIELWLRGRLADNRTVHGGGDRETFDNRWIDGNMLADRDIWGGSERDFGISVAGGFVRFGTGRGDDPQSPDRGSTIEGNTLVLDDAWHHVACVRDAATGRKAIWVDGVLDFEGALLVSTSDLSYPDDGVPGQQTPWGPYLVLAAEKHDAGPAYPSFRGRLDEVRVWRTARSALAIASSWDVVLPPGTPDLVGSYRLEEGAGTAVLDASGAGSPPGELIAGIPGNGEWASAAVVPGNTAPVRASGPLATLAVDGSPSGIAIGLGGVLRATPFSVVVPAGTIVVLEAPATANPLGANHAFVAWSDGGARAHAVAVPAQGLDLLAVFVRASSGTVSSTVSAQDRNAEFHPSTGQSTANAFDPFGLCCGRDGGGTYEAGVQFALPVPQRALLRAATLRLVATADQSGSVTARIRAYDVGDAPPFAPGSRTPLTAHAPLGSASVTWTMPPFAPGQSYGTPDLAAVLQPVVDRADFAPGSFVGLVLEPITPGASDWRCFRNFASGAPAMLDVTFGTEPAGSFTQFGQGVGGARGVPELLGSGDLGPGSRDGFVCWSRGLATGAVTALAFGGNGPGFPLFGGRVFTDPLFDALALGPAPASGTVTFRAALPNGIPSGSVLVLQALALDATAPFGVVMTRALRLDAP
jgi:hypothetical protein